MSLFSTEDLTKKKPDRPKSGSVPFTGPNLLTIGKANEKLHQVFGQVVDGQSVHYASLGDWSTHDLLFFLLEQTGPARVYFTTCLLYTSPSPRDRQKSRMPSSA